MAEVLHVAARPERGSRASMKLRSAGRVPAVLYGHGQDPMSLAIPAEEVALMIRHGSRLVTLEGAAAETAFVKEVQWNTWGTSVLHVDLARVSADERVEVEVTIELRGEAVGVKEGGVVEHVLHSVRLECPVISIPDKLRLRIAELKVGGQLTLANLELPEGAKLLDDPEAVVAQCEIPQEESDEGAAGEGGAEPEVIGRKEKEEEEGEE